MNHSVPAQPRPIGSPLRVLFADPDESLLAEYQEHAKEGFEVVTAFNGLECVDRMREQPPDVLVLEPDLPWGGGDGVLARMHDELDLGSVPVMLLTSCRDPSVLDGIACFPISDYHTKPLSAAQLVRRLYSTLERHATQSHFEEENRRLEGLVAKQTNGRIQRLRVERNDRGIVIHGRSGTYEARQLAFAIVTEALEASQCGPLRVELDIQVGSMDAIL